MTTHTNDTAPLLTPAEVAAIFHVDPKTVTRWATAGKVTAIRTPGGHRRFLEAEILARRNDELPPLSPTQPSDHPGQPQIASQLVHPSLRKAHADPSENTESGPAATAAPSDDLTTADVATTADTAVVVAAQRVADAAAEVASTVTAADSAIENEVARAATALQTAATALARELAANSTENLPKPSRTVT